MISVGNNKAVICKGDFRPAQLYKGDRKIAGYTVEEFEGTGSIALLNCYNDKVYAVSVDESIQSITVRGKNYFDLNKVPFSNSTTQPYRNGLKVTKSAATNRGDRIPISLPAGKTIYLTLDVVDSQIGGTAKRVALDFLDSDKNRVVVHNITSTIAKKSYSFTLSEEVSYIQFYFQANDTSNVVGDYVTMDNIMLRTEGDDLFELYIEPKTVNIVLDEPLTAGGVIQKSVDNLPPLPQFKDTTIYEVMADTPPSGIEVCYYG